MISYNLYIKNTLGYFDNITEAFDILGMHDKKVLSLEEMVKALFVYHANLIGEIISQSKMEEMINEVKSGKRNVTYKGHPIEIVDEL